ncbi:hypothetical protein ASPZODRAFT_2067593 [Penicilliopsis zonata CBS 506.65]|uniref:Palmitoyltransferase PFA4 n=1 Tax=Penicilliopsis zonata CBS 506.65 TaxID=1073090 RepID=A0A1L9SG62_9EURO|nr:hypothetical protein ASPZODRAFT_2067593 [Penicilliopsis zonata CBS 506.65]OJJ46156.1 hypothetical protein ASPZODRAFT_2067593 [Penicilliopsis zonata CBS 506.65]
MARESFQISQLAVPAVSVLISFLAYTSQYLFLHFEDAPLTNDEVWGINCFALCIWICYYRACTVDPGRLPQDWEPPQTNNGSTSDAQGSQAEASGRQRWCRKCEAFKPPRAHHCKTCQRCIPKMDHHCPWTSNCVSHFTFPHFIRFLFFAVVGMGYLETRLFLRGSILWANRNLPSYLGPSVFQMFHLFLLIVVNSLTVFTLSILLFRSLWSLGANETTIETWEIERHKTLVRRAKYLGGYLDGPGGVKIQIKKQEFPYDIGIWSNIKAGMGGSLNIFSWFWPLAATQSRKSGWDFPVNGFEDSDLSWPPPDPDRIPRPLRQMGNEPFTVPQQYSSAREEIQAFNRRQAEDMVRVQRRKRFHDRFGQDGYDEPASTDEDNSGAESSEPDEGEESWKNSEGERLRDFGVDEAIEFYDEEDIPLGVLMRRRRHS